MRKGKRIIRSLCWAHFLMSEIAFNQATIKDTNFEAWINSLYGKRFADSLGWSSFEEAVEEARSGDWTHSIHRQLQQSLGLECNPVSFWEAEWDGLWRMVTFDLPHNAFGDRKNLSRTLRFWRFGNLQGSVWISPHPPGDFLRSLRRKNISARGLFVSEGNLLAPSSDRDIVEQTWDWVDINVGYNEFEKEIDQALAAAREIQNPTQDWLMEQVHHTFQLWSASSISDPFLPRKLWPQGYRGPKAYKKFQKFRQTLKDRFPTLIAAEE